MDPRHPEHQADHRSSRLEPLPRVVDGSQPGDVDRYVGPVNGYIDIDGYQRAVDLQGCLMAVSTFAIGLFGTQAVLQSDLAIRAVFGVLAAVAIAARLSAGSRLPDPAHFVRRDR